MQGTTAWIDAEKKSFASVFKWIISAEWD
jgi:hypothetical protein